MKLTRLIRPIAFLLNPGPALELPSRAPLDRGQHWHQPLLPCEGRAADETFGVAVTSLLTRLGIAARRLSAMPKVWMNRHESRRKLGELSDYMLRDIGLTRADVWQETSKPFWRG